MLKKYCIVRDHRAGVFAGTLIWINENVRQNIKLTNCRKLWYWSGASGVEQIALEGVQNPSSCKFTVEVEEQELFDCVQIIKASPKAKKNIEKVKPWKM